MTCLTVVTLLLLPLVALVGCDSKVRASASPATDSDLRLRYEFLRELAPYVGARFQGLTFETADMAGPEGEDTSRFFLLGGVRFAAY